MTDLVFENPPDIKEGYTANILLYGPPGAGKSTGASTAPGPILYLNADRPNAIAFARLKLGNERFREFKLRTASDLHRAKAYIEDNYAELGAVVLDKVNNLHMSLLMEMVGGADYGRATQQQYGDVNNAIYKFCETVKDLDVNFIMICDEDYMKDELSGALQRMPMTGGKALPRQLCGMADIVGYCRGEVADGKAKYRAHFVGVPSTYGKDGTDALGHNRIINISRWLDTIQTYYDPNKENIVEA